MRIACPTASASDLRYWLLALAIIVLSHPFTLQGQNQTTSSAPPITPHTEEDFPLYRNTTLGFRYHIPYGWVDRTKEMQEGNDSGAEVLLSVFERPPAATGDTVNSAIVIASERASSYPGLKTAADYMGPITELATAKGFKPVGEPDALEIDSRQLLRADFAKPRGGQLTMRQCTLVLLAKGRIVSFTFIAGSEDEIEELVEGLHFGDSGRGSASPERGKPSSRTKPNPHP